MPFKVTHYEIEKIYFYIIRLLKVKNRKAYFNMQLTSFEWLKFCAPLPCWGNNNPYIMEA